MPYKKSLLNKVFINKKGCIEIIYRGDQSESTVKAVHKEIIQLQKSFPKIHKSFKYIVNLDELGSSDSAARKEVVAHLDELNMYRLAVIGGDHIIRSLAKLILRATLHHERMRYFDRRSEAESWLNQ